MYVHEEASPSPAALVIAMFWASLLVCLVIKTLSRLTRLPCCFTLCRMIEKCSPHLKMKQNKTKQNKYLPEKQYKKLNQSIFN